MKKIVKISNKTVPASAAGAIAGGIKEGKEVEVQAIGAAAVNQAVKAVCIARMFLSPHGIHIAVMPYLNDIEEGKTAVSFAVVKTTSEGIPEERRILKEKPADTVIKKKPFFATGFEVLYKNAWYYEYQNAKGLIRKRRKDIVDQGQKGEE